jgi:hypothetical protein
LLLQAPGLPSPPELAPVRRRPGLGAISSWLEQAVIDSIKDASATPQID